MPLPLFYIPLPLLHPQTHTLATLHRTHEAPALKTNIAVRQGPVHTTFRTASLAPSAVVDAGAGVAGAAGTDSAVGKAGVGVSGFGLDSGDCRDEEGEEEEHESASHEGRLGRGSQDRGQVNFWCCA